MKRLCADGAHGEATLADKTALLDFVIKVAIIEIIRRIEGMKGFMSRRLGERRKEPLVGRMARWKRLMRDETRRTDASQTIHIALGASLVTRLVH